jgi:hypothetical protein
MSTPSAELSAKQTEDARQLINDVIQRGQLPGIHIECLSCYDLNVRTKDVPKHEPGHRNFYITLKPTAKNPWTSFILLSAFEPGSDYIKVPLGSLLGRVSEIESQLGQVDEIVGDLATAAGRIQTLRERGKTTSDVLHVVERSSNKQLDALRELAADPRTWSPISETAILFAAGECYGKRGSE